MPPLLRWLMRLCALLCVMLLVAVMQNATPRIRAAVTPLRRIPNATAELAALRTELAMLRARLATATTTMTAYEVPHQQVGAVPGAALPRAHFAVAKMDEPARCDVVLVATPPQGPLWRQVATIEHTRALMRAMPHACMAPAALLVKRRGRLRALRLRAVVALHGGKGEGEGVGVALSRRCDHRALSVVVHAVTGGGGGGGREDDARVLRGVHEGLRAMQADMSVAGNATVWRVGSPHLSNVSGMVRALRARAVGAHVTCVAMRMWHMAWRAQMDDGGETMQISAHLQMFVRAAYGRRVHGGGGSGGGARLGVVAVHTRCAARRDVVCVTGGEMAVGQYVKRMRRALALHRVARVYVQVEEAEEMGWLVGKVVKEVGVSDAVLDDALLRTGGDGLLAQVVEWGLGVDADVVVCDGGSAWAGFMRRRRAEAAGCGRACEWRGMVDVNGNETVVEGS